MPKREESSPSPRENASQSSLEDDALIRDARNGMEKAYTRLVDKYQRALNYRIHKMISEEERVPDLVQEIFAKAFENLHNYNHTYAFSTWLYRIATNHTIDYLRKKRLQTLSIDKPMASGDDEMRMQLPDHSSPADQKIITSQRKQIVRQAIDELPDKYRRVIELRHMQEKSYNEIAQLLDSPLGTVKAHIYRAREMLYKALKDKRGSF